ncbi:MAG TPA: SpoIIE family protein phosphatase, partial [Acidimicrobiales bacterium]|nr:SpoIIE family protein phosphatase [Acidimicrobiales bacterium]
ALAAVYSLVDDRAQQPLAVFTLPVLFVGVLASGRHAFVVGAASTAAAAALGLGGPLNAAGLTARLLIVVTSWALAVVAATTRTKREERTMATDARAIRVSRALHVGQIGTWQWDRESGHVDWDADLHALFGLRVGDFEGTFEAWARLLHPNDRLNVLAAVDVGLEVGDVFRFDHRCVWPDGSVHWLHGVGEAVVDDDGKVVGAAGLTLNIDERVRLLEIERTATARARFLERTNRALVESLDLDEVLERITNSAIDGLADWCSLVVTIDQPSETPLIAIAHADPAMVTWARQLQRQYPFDPDAPSGVPHVLRTGQVEFVPVIDSALLDALDIPSDLRDVIVRLDLHSSITVPLLGGLGTLGALQLVRTSQRPSFTEADVALARDLAGSISAALNTTVLFRRQQAAQSALTGLQHFTAQLSELSTTAAIAEVVVHSSVELTSADCGVIYLSQMDGSLELAAHAGYTTDQLATSTLLPRDCDAPIAHAVRTREPIVLATRTEMKQRSTHVMDATADDGTIVALPLFVAGRTVGGMLVTWRSPHVVTDTEMSLLRTIAGRGAGALERARLYETQRSISVTLQRSLLPRELDTPSWLAAAARHWPGVVGTEVGGDFYDLFRLSDDRWAVTIGDVCGHGIEAAAVTSVARHTARSAARHVTTPSQILECIHEALHAYDGANYCTVCFITLERGEGHVTANVALGGHPRPLIRRRDGTVQAVGTPGTLLGIIPPRTHTIQVRLDAGDIIVMYTDGVTDAPGHLAVSIDELEHTLREPDNPNDCLRAISELLEHRRPDGVSDDTAVVVVQIVADQSNRDDRSGHSVDR